MIPRARRWEASQAERKQRDVERKKRDLEYMGEPYDKEVRKRRLLGPLEAEPAVPVACQRGAPCLSGRFLMSAPQSTPPPPPAQVTSCDQLIAYLARFCPKEAEEKKEEEKEVAPVKAKGAGKWGKMTLE
mmetsp:Transcript_38997/g.124111  ORF Transcript_38997/g.124111 Transcript_38997/m.124111 type:complete len:130 (-) Transcript_38997:162-551(-)